MREPFTDPFPRTGSMDAAPPSPRPAKGSWVGTPFNDWPAWSGLVVLLAALVLAAVGGLIVDIPAIALGVKLSSSHTPPGIELGDTVAQDIVFVLSVILFAQMGGRKVRSWQIGFRPTHLRRAVGLVLLLLVSFLILSAVWAALLNESTKEKLLEQLGAENSVLLLALSALLTTVIAPVCEETLFRGYVFPALSKWKGWIPAAILTGILFGGVHAGSAPANDLLPLGALGFFLCALYQRTGSLYPGIAAHSLNNSLAFGVLEGWGWQIPLLMAAALLTIGLLVLASQSVGLISAAPADDFVALTAYDSQR